jgi:hypothetical protein
MLKFVLKKFTFDRDACSTLKSKNLLLNIAQSKIKSRLLRRSLAVLVAPRLFIERTLNLSLRGGYEITNVAISFLRFFEPRGKGTQNPPPRIAICFDLTFSQLDRGATSTAKLSRVERSNKRLCLLYFCFRKNIGLSRQLLCNFLRVTGKRFVLKFVLKKFAFDRDACSTLKSKNSLLRVAKILTHPNLNTKKPP